MPLEKCKRCKEKFGSLNLFKHDDQMLCNNCYELAVHGRRRNER